MSSRTRLRCRDSVCRRVVSLPLTHLYDRHARQRGLFGALAAPGLSNLMARRPLTRWPRGPRRGVFLVTCRRDPQTPPRAKEYLNSLDHQSRAQKLTIICNRPCFLTKQLQCVSIAAPSRPCVPMAKARTCSFGILRPKPSRTPARHPESM